MLEDQVCKLEFAQRLKELGFKQESYFYWTPDDTNETWKIEHCARIWSAHYSAFTVAELIAMVPEFKEPYRFLFGVENPSVCMPKYFATCDVVNYPEDYDIHGDNLADCLAEQFIHLVTNKAMEVPK